MIKTLKIVTQCCECRRVKDGEDWHYDMQRHDVTYSHGYCPACMKEALVRFGLETGYVNQALAMAQ
jgi:hypothetical protein